MTEPRSTIVALSSGAMPSGVAVIRLSGPLSRRAVRLLAGSVPEPRRLMLRTLRDEKGAELDTGLVAYFPAPNSFTGEDCAELHVHGSRAVVAAVLAVLVVLDGVELAGPGDFTRRAFEAGRLDLTQVEGLGDLIAAETESQRRQAIERAKGWLGAEIADWRAEIIYLRAEIEARLDFSDEGDVAEDLPESFARKLDELRQTLTAVLSGYDSGRITRDGFRVVLAGAPNAGKSSLLNALAGSDEAIVSPEAGTTRDVKEVQLNLDGHLLRLFDVAGLRQSESLAETEGVRRAEKAMADADLVLWLTAPDVGAIAPPDLSGAVWTIASKSDLSPGTDPQALALSVVTGQGIETLKRRLADHVAASVRGEASLISHLRDKRAIETALGFLAKASAPDTPEELRAEDLRLAGQALAQLTGEIDAEQVLDRLFAGFCIGK